MSDDREAFLRALHGVRRDTPASREDAQEAEKGRAQAAAMQGMVIIVASVLVYCFVAFRSGLDFELGEIIGGAAAPIATASLAGMGAGLLLWLFGCAAYMQAAMHDGEGPG